MEGLGKIPLERVDLLVWFALVAFVSYLAGYISAWDSFFCVYAV